MKVRDVLAALPGIEELAADGLTREIQHAYFELAAGEERLRLRYFDGGVRDLVLPAGTVARVFGARRDLRELVRRAGRRGTCRGCGAEVYWLQHAGAAAASQPSRRAGEGPWAPYNTDGQNHFVDCPAREAFRRPREERAV